MKVKTILSLVAPPLPLGFFLLDPQLLEDHAEGATTTCRCAGRLHVLSESSWDSHVGWKMRRKDISELLRVQWKKVSLIPAPLVGEAWTRAQRRR